MTTLTEKIQAIIAFGRAASARHDQPAAGRMSDFHQQPFHDSHSRA